jgi:hypothetical protein
MDVIGIREISDGCEDGRENQKESGKSDQNGFRLIQF